MNRQDQFPKIKIGVSSCLVGEKVRWNGDHKQDRFVREMLGAYFEYVPVCPEVEVGMGVPRETVALYGELDSPKMISKKSRKDWTKPMRSYLKDRINGLSDDALCGYIFKSKSPSCGLGRVPVYTEMGSAKVRHGPGMFADAFMKAFPLIPVEDEGRLNDARLRENFIVRVFCYQRLQSLMREGLALKSLVRFHTQHKFLLLSYSRKHYDALGQLVGNPKSVPRRELFSRYGELFMETLQLKSTPKKNTDVLLHMMGFFKTILSKEEKEDILNVIHDYRNELLPLIVPVTLIRHQVSKHNIEYLKDQVYLNPHPKELMLRNHV
ncbi:MAG: DUF523 and DUF1722 domain-containing protein [Candidatus Nitrohelix vancouverensis]|uniref:DUF523 and DUF1722 domain-containing protein n=1 Tax=Candidatus Nitrohelix vancouverensis TaxID=2705534 RepID=A0A7T0G2T6_9BACT|nr:MAG: DUF523 and DUF1722 domain-containing protein [Candidatus Nitrohelix vancouverensis]